MQVQLVIALASQGAHGLGGLDEMPRGARRVSEDGQAVEVVQRALDEAVSTVWPRLGGKTGEHAAGEHVDGRIAGLPARDTDLPAIVAPLGTVRKQSTRG